MTAKLDPLAKARDFLYTPRPRVAPLSPARQMDRLKRQVREAQSTATIANNGVGGSSAAVFDALPDATSEDVGENIVVRGQAGQPNKRYAATLDPFDNPIWIQASDDAPFIVSLERRVPASIGPISPINGIALGPRGIYINDGSLIAEVSYNLTTTIQDTTAAGAANPIGGQRMAYGKFDHTFGIIGEDDTSGTDGFQVWDATDMSRLFEVNASGTGDGQFDTAHDLAQDEAGNWYVTDRDNNRVQKFSAAGAFVTKWGSFGVGDGQFLLSTGICVDSDGNVHVAEQGSARIQKFSPTGTHLLTYGGTGTAPGQIASTSLLTIDANENGWIVIVTFGSSAIYLFDNNGVELLRFTTPAVGFDEGWFWYDVSTHGPYIYATDLTKGIVYGFLVSDQGEHLAIGTGTTLDFALVDPRAQSLRFDADQFDIDALVPGAVDVSLAVGVLSGSVADDPASTANGARHSVSVTVTGAAVGDPAVCGHTTITSAGWRFDEAHVIAADTVRCSFLNNTGGTVDPGAGTARAVVFKV